MKHWIAESNAGKMNTVGKVKLCIVISLELTISKREKKLYKLNSSGRRRVEIKSITKRNSTQNQIAMHVNVVKLCQTSTIR